MKYQVKSSDTDRKDFDFALGGWVTCENLKLLPKVVSKFKKSNRDFLEQLPKRDDVLSLYRIIHLSDDELTEFKTTKTLRVTKLSSWSLDEEGAKQGMSPQVSMRLKIAETGCGLMFKKNIPLKFRLVSINDFKPTTFSGYEDEKEIICYPMTLNWADVYKMQTPEQDEFIKKLDT
jgi:hypothetical protein